MQSERLLRALGQKRRPAQAISRQIQPEPESQRVQQATSGSALRSFLQGFRKSKASGPSVGVADMHHVTFDEVLLAGGGGASDLSDPSHIFLGALESLRELVFFVFTLSGQNGSRRSFQSLLKLVARRFSKLILRCPDSVGPQVSFHEVCLTFTLP
jgi:hypothetical protein